MGSGARDEEGYVEATTAGGAKNGDEKIGEENHHDDSK